MIKINDKEYKNLVTKLERNATILYSENSGLTIANTQTLDAMGTRIDYVLKVEGVAKDQEQLQEFWDDIVKARNEGIVCEMPYNQTSLKFSGFVKEVSQPLERMERNKVIWGSIQITITAESPQFEEVI